jgi:hypothetical protein
MNSLKIKIRSNRTNLHSKIELMFLFLAKKPILLDIINSIIMCGK